MGRSRHPLAFILHGILVGLVATLIYVALTRFQPEPAAYIVAHFLKLAGGALGGYVASRRAAHIDLTKREVPA